MGTSTVDWGIGEGFLEEVVSELSFEDRAGVCKVKGDLIKGFPGR